VEVEFFKPSDAGAVFKAAGYVEQAQAVAARIEMSYFNLADKQPELAAIDARLIEHNKARWNVLKAGS
jgi:hypothetical protein